MNAFEVYFMICLCCFLQVLISAKVMEWVIKNRSKADAPGKVGLKLAIICSLLIIWPIVLALKITGVPKED